MEYLLAIFKLHVDWHEANLNLNDGEIDLDAFKAKISFEGI